VKIITLISVILLLSGCNQAPLSLRTFTDGDAEAGELVAELQYLLREGKYCSYILVGDKNSDNKEALKVYEGNVSLKYKVEIPSINYVNEVDLGKFATEDYGFFYEGGYSSHQFTIEVANIPSYRANVKTTLYVYGSTTLLKSGEFGIQFSEWQCK